jgi:protoheme IX farnesyltransferase
MADARPLSSPIPLDAHAPTLPPAALPTAPTVKKSLLASYADLGKIRLNAMVVVTTALGFVIGSDSLFPPRLDLTCLAWTCLGTFFAAIGASAFNQAIEAPRDARMNRTKNRPIPAGRISRAHAAYFGLLATIVGVAVLCPTSNGLTALLALANVILYALVYTPLKPRSSTNTLVGALVGGIPPVMGWTAATGSVAPGALALGALLFAWQIPHFLALAWMYREDYARGGYKMVSTSDPSGARTSTLSVIYSLLLLVPCLALVFLGHASGFFGYLALILTAWLTFAALRFAASRETRDARRLFLATLLYLPLLSLLLILFAQTPLDHMNTGAAGHASKPTEPFINPDLNP